MTTSCVFGQRQESGVSRTLWGLPPETFVDLFWGRRGVQLVAPGTSSPIQHQAELFLLVPAGKLVLFSPLKVFERFAWISPAILCLRLHAGGSVTRVGVTEDRSMAESWRTCDSPAGLWRTWRHTIPQNRRAVLSCPATVCDGQQDSEVTSFMCQLAAVWRNPEIEIHRARKVCAGVWRDAETPLDAPVTVKGTTIWLGAGQSQPGPSCSGKAIVLWDLPTVATEADAGLSSSQCRFERQFP